MFLLIVSGLDLKFLFIERHYHYRSVLVPTIGIVIVIIATEMFGGLSTQMAGESRCQFSSLA
jgi:hypothetical protein